MSIITLKQALLYGKNELKSAGIISTQLDAEVLISFVLGWTMEKLISNVQYPITNTQFAKYKELIKKRSENWPVAYLTGSKEFYGIDFFVNQDVLVPRPETELLVESVIKYCRGEPLCSPKYRRTRGSAPTILEIGTGSGCIALTLGKYLPGAKITACDISEKALKVARKNKMNPKIKNVKLIKSDLLSNIRAKPDILVANLPYLDNLKEILKESESKALKYEPPIALKGGKDGLDIYRKLFRQIKGKNWGKMLILVEIGDTQAKPLKKYVSSLFPGAEIEIKKDLAKRDRVLIVRT